MAIAKTRKIQLLTTLEHKTEVLELLQNTNAMELQAISTEEGVETQHSPNQLQKLQEIELEFANIDYSIKVLSRYVKAKGLLAEPICLNTDQVKEKAEESKHKEITKEILKHENNLLQARNEKAAFQAELDTYQVWKNLGVNLENLDGSANSKIILGSLKKENYNEIYQAVNNVSALTSIEKINQDDNNAYILIVFSKELETELREITSRYKFTETELPREKGLLKAYNQKLQKQIETCEETIEKAEKELKSLSKHLDELMIVHDYLNWEKEKLEEDKKLTKTNYSCIIQGWIPEKNIEKIEDQLSKITNRYLLREIEPEKGENIPVVIKNNKFIEPFEAVTEIYGLPKSTEIDPTPFLAVYFIVFFGMCLTDAAYGIIMFVCTALALKFLKLPQGLRKLVKLLMYGGLVTFVIGGLFGGWFSLSPDQVPDFLTTTTDSGEQIFIFQKINSLTDPLTVLILSLGLGFFQILMGTYMKLIHAIKTGNKIDAILDVGPWAFMLTGIGFAILAAASVLPQNMIAIGKWWVILGAVIIVLTQGRDKKNIVGKLVSGFLSLYDLIGYLSDVLSYSRLLALGLATAIIGLAVNIIAVLMKDMIPYVGWIFMIIVFVGGHVFNILINTLGSFIHSGRLQFVEFFGKFLEGGGTGLKPFSKKCKYIFIKNNS
ncbi:V-type ATP synthase subunit I [Patescibacteria group bacterium]|nr:V-type ATP synthase subunit I [Patescibacteria group bacterium]